MIKKNIIIDNLLINYYQSDKFNNKNAIVFLHGWMSSAKLFKNILDHCHNFIAIELPGFNGSEIPEKDWKLDDYANFLHDFLEKTNLSNAILVGHSFGGNIILKYLINGFDSKKAILIASSGVRKRNLKVKIYYYLSRIIKIFYIIPGFKKIILKYRKRFYQNIDSEDYINAGQLTKIYKNIINEDLTDNLKGIKRDVDIIWGDRDKNTPINQAEIIHQNIANSKLFIIKDAGHFCFLDQPKKFNEIFLKLIEC